MTLVRIVKSWTKPDLLRQTPGGTGTWGDIRFTLDPVERCDYLIALNHLPEDLSIEVPPANVWCFIQEPPVPSYRWLRRGFSSFARVYTPDAALAGSRYIHRHGSLPWHVDRSYDQLHTAPFPEKTKGLSWITSDARNKPGHTLRMDFLDRLRAGVSFDLFGRGFQPIDDKWDGLAPYRYAIAFENHSGPDYWTEKIADCFLAGAMPFYYGATNIADYFPRESYIPIDPRDPATPRRIAEIVASDLAEKNRDAIAEARRRVLEEHQFFPRVAALISESRRQSPEPALRRLQLPGNPNLTGYYLAASPLRRLWLDFKFRLHELRSRADH